MARPGPANDEERLPWLEPYRDNKLASVAPAKPKSRGRLLAAAAAVAVLVAAGGGYILGQREPEPVAPTAEIAVNMETPAPAPIEQSISIPTDTVETPAVVEPDAQATGEARPTNRMAQIAPGHPVRHYAQSTPTRRARIAVARIRAARAVQVHRAHPAPRIAYRPWPKMPSPGPAGQVIQLGAFTNPTRANAALRLRVARYPALGQMPRVVVPVITRPRGQILYVLRLGTTSRQQSSIVCRNLRASGDHCLVIG